MRSTSVMPPIQGTCPASGKLGFHRGVLHNGTSVDPLERLYTAVSYNFGGAQRYITSIATAIQAFIDREYPDVGSEGLTVVPDLQSPQGDIKWADLSKHCVVERHGGLVQSKFFHITYTTIPRPPGSNLP